MSEVALAVLLRIPACADGETIAFICMVSLLPDKMLPKDRVHGFTVILVNVPPFKEYCGFIN